MHQTTSLKPRTLPQSFVRFIRLDDEWPLFSLTLVLHDESQTAWAYLSHLPDLAGRGEGLLHLFREWRRLERWCYHDGILGWYCICAEGNVRFTRWLLAIGAEPVLRMPGRGIQYQKKLLVDPCERWAKFNLKEIASSIRNGRSGHA